MVVAKVSFASFGYILGCKILKSILDVLLQTRKIIIVSLISLLSELEFDMTVHLQKQKPVGLDEPTLYVECHRPAYISYDFPQFADMEHDSGTSKPLKACGEGVKV
jgi:hypothetical protein